MGTVETSQRRREAFHRYVVPELDVLLRVALRLTRRRPDAEDLVQDTLFRAYRAVDRFDGAHPRAWLLTIMRNAHRNSGRRRRPGLLDDEDQALGLLRARGADGREGPAESVTEAFPDQALVDALRRLPATQRAVIALIDIDGLSYREAADLLGIPTGTVTSRLHRARRRLRARLERAWAQERAQRDPLRPPMAPSSAGLRSATGQ
jgi:RNA polymerase sigma-70 factor (ECF subfamily)